MLPRVLGVPFRAPALVAKAAESLDRLSGGRLLLGLGAGGDDSEFRALGLPVRSPAEKVRGLEEAVRIVKGLWSEPSLTHHGTIYHTEDAQLDPKPAHRIPIWLGTFGERALEVTGRVADGWIPSRGYVPDEALPVMRDPGPRRGRASGPQPGRSHLRAEHPGHASTTERGRHPGRVHRAARQDRRQRAALRRARLHRVQLHPGRRRPGGPGKPGWPPRSSRR